MLPPYLTGHPPLYVETREGHCSVCIYLRELMIKYGFNPDLVRFEIGYDSATGENS